MKEVGRKGKAVDGTVAHRPTKLNRTLLLRFHSVNSGILQLRVKHVVQRTCRFASEHGAPDIEIAAAMRGHKLVLSARDPFEASYASSINGALITSKENNIKVGRQP